MSQIDPYSREFEHKLVSSIKRLGGEVTVADVSADTGLPFNQTEIGLRHLLEIYDSHLDVDDDGNLRYRYSLPMVRRGHDPWAFWYKIRDSVWGALSFLFKIWTMVMLVGYTVLFILFLVALLFASRGKDDRRDDGDFGGAFFLIPRILDYLFWFQIMSPDRYNDRRNVTYVYDDRGNRHASDEPFYLKVNRFVFGPEREELSEDEKQREFAQFVRYKKGILTAADWAEHTGLSLEEADSQLTEGIVLFAGDVAVTPDGTLLYKFDEMKVTASVDDGRKWTSYDNTPPQPIWEKPFKGTEFTGNNMGANIGIGVMATFIFIVSNYCLHLAAAPPVDLNPQFLGIIASPAFSIVMGWIPLVYSILFLLIPLLRLIPFVTRKLKENGEILRRKGIRKIYQSTSHGKAIPVSLDGFQDKALALAYDGDLDVESGSPTTYTFDVLATQRYAGETARVSSERAVVFGKTIYSSDDALYDEDQGELDDFDAKVEESLGDKSESYNKYVHEEAHQSRP